MDHIQIQIYKSMNKRLIIVGTISLLLWGFISIMSQGLPLEWCQVLDYLSFHLFSEEVTNMANGFYYEVNNNDMPTVIFLFIFTVIFVLMCALIKPMEEDKERRSSLWIIVGFSLLFRLVLLPSEPIHENDFYRYLWDGKSAVHKINPFKHAPSDLFMFEEGYVEDHYDEYREVTLKAPDLSNRGEERLKTLIQLRDENPLLYERIGHWQVPTIYPPATQLLFTVISFLREDSFIFMKFIFLIFDMGILFLIIGLLKHFRLNPGLCFIYGWSPLVIKEFANAGHYDPLAMFFTMGALFLWVKGRRTFSVFSLAMATLAKLFGVILLPLFLKFKNLWHYVLFLIIVSISYLPYFLWDNTGVKGVFEGLMTYNKEWYYNASLFAVLLRFLKTFFSDFSNPLVVTKIMVGLGFLTFVWFLVKKKENEPLELLHKCFLTLAALFVIGPVGDPWYFCWSIPFLCFFPYRSWIFLSGLLMFSYLNFHSDIMFLEKDIFNIPLLNWLIYVPFYLYLTKDLIKEPVFRQNSMDAPKSKEVK